MISPLLSLTTRFLIGALPRWQASQPEHRQRIYFANHTSHLDTLAIWSSLPAELRKTTRPVAARDYWDKAGVRRHIATQGLNVVFISRDKQSGDPLAPLYEALENGDSLIIFPEGTRHFSPLPAPFKSGLYYLAQKFKTVELIPVYLDNTRRCLPKGSLIPVPLACTVTYGAPLEAIEHEEKAAFLQRAREAVIALAPTEITTD